MGIAAVVLDLLWTGKTVVGLLFEQVAFLKLGRDICGEWTTAIGREWLVTNGLGGYACGTVAGANTRRYHGFLVASRSPPVERMMLVSKVDVSVEYLGKLYHLSSNEFAGGAVNPHGFVHLQSFTVEHGIPIWTYAIGDALLEQRIFMAPGTNSAYLRLQSVRASAPLAVEFKPLVGNRDHHSQGRGIQPLRATGGADRCTVLNLDDEPLYSLGVSAGRYVPGDTWYWNFLHREEFGRGLDALEDLWGPGIFRSELAPQRSVYFTASAGPSAVPSGDDVQSALVARSQHLIDQLPVSAPTWVRTLATASDQFVVQRGTGKGATMSIIAGYPWFSDWGRDTMISLPGLTTTLRRFDVGAKILRAYGAIVDRGMLPNRFPDTGEGLEYNTADATLWMFHAVSEQLEAKRDPGLQRDMFPTLAAIVHAHVDGTRFGIKVDSDGLLRAGEPGVQLTWMDAKQGDHVFTPRIGKPVEINALWLNALEVTARLAGRLRKPAEKRYCQELMERASASFARFWNPAKGCLYDVLDVDGGNSHDSSVRPNQILAVSLPHCVLPEDQMRAVVDTCARQLLTSYGLRTLSPDDPNFVGRYDGNAWQRDAAYHEGTAWAWLLGPFVRAHYRAYGDAALALSLLNPVAEHLADACMGSVSEIFDGEAPHRARGCFAQAWSVAEILRSWVYLDGKISAT